MLTVTITVQGKRFSDVEDAIKEATKDILARVPRGSDATEDGTGSYSFVASGREETHVAETA